MRFEVFSEKPFEIVLYSRFLGCNPAKPRIQRYKMGVNAAQNS